MVFIFPLLVYSICEFNTREMDCGGDIFDRLDFKPYSRPFGVAFGGVDDFHRALRKIALACRRYRLVAQGKRNIKGSLARYDIKNVPVLAFRPQRPAGFGGIGIPFPDGQIVFVGQGGKQLVPQCFCGTQRGSQFCIGRLLRFADERVGEHKLVSLAAGTRGPGSAVLNLLLPFHQDFDHVRIGQGRGIADLFHGVFGDLAENPTHDFA